MKTMRHDEAIDILRSEVEGGQVSIIDKPECVGGKDDVLNCLRTSDGSVFVLRRASKVPYYKRRYYYEVYTALEVA